MLISVLIGNFRRYQLWITFLIFINRFGVAFHNMAIIFLAPPVKYTCDHNETCCDNPVYDTSIFKKTIVTEWNLICGRSWMKDATQTLFQFGVLVGSVVMGMISDRFGRRRTLIFSVIFEVFTGVMAAVIPDFWSFTVVRMFLGVSVGGVMVVGFVIIMEYVGSRHRDVIAALYQIPFTMGHVLLAAFGYFFRDYSYFQLAISLSCVFLLCYICLLPESPRWLVAKNKTAQAVKLITRIAIINKLPTEEIETKIQLYQMEHHMSRVKKGTVIDLFRTPNLRKNILIMSLNWLVCSYCFYGISQYISHLSGNIFVNVVITGTLTTIGTLLSIPAMKFLGRKTVLMSSNISCSICLFCLAIIPQGLVSIFLASFGALFSFMVFVVVYLYTIELFPTVVRNAALGICSMMARVGSMIAPFVAALDEHETWYAPIAFGLFPLITALLSYFLPETKNCELLMTIEEGEAFGNPNFRDTETGTAML